MGGNALKADHGLESKRMNRDQYEHLKENVSKFLDNLGIVYAHTKSYHNKTDFGDLDIVVSRENDAVEKIRTHLRIAGLPMTNEFTMSQNTDFINTMITQFQVDFIIVEPEQLFSATTYYSYNDIWNLLGKVVKSHDYKIGWQGLLYTYRNGGHYKEDILLSSDILDALPLMGLDKNVYLNGFDDYDDMFEFVIASTAFDKTKFALENLNNRNRVRDRKRKTYNLFLKYIEDKEYPDVTPMPLPTKAFPHLVAEIQKREDVFRDKNRAKEIINGNVIVEVTGLQHRDVKDVIETIRSRYTVEDILKFSHDDAKDIIRTVAIELGKQIT